MTRAARRWIGAAVALFPLACRADPPPPPPGAIYDWCSSVVLRPDERRREEGARCVAAWTDAEIAAGAELVLLGSYADVERENAATSPTSRCVVPETHRARGRYVADLRARRAEVGGPPLRFVHMHRFDLVSAPLAAEPGFRADFLLTTDRPWREVEAFFAADRSPRCGPDGCRWSHAPGGFEDRARGAWLRDSIDAAGGPGRAESVVYYLARAAQIQNRFWPTAAIADLRNPGYRAWRVALAKRALEVGGYDAIALNQKFHMYRAPYWIGSEKARDVAALRADGDDTLWSAPPRGYGYPEYVTGWVALANDLRAAGVPYAIVDFPAWPWERERADDPSTPARDEGRSIREVAKGARIVLLERHARSDPRGLEAWAAELRAAGVEVFWMDTSCELRRP